LNILEEGLVYAVYFIQSFIKSVNDKCKDMGEKKCERYNSFDIEEKLENSEPEEVSFMDQLLKWSFSGEKSMNDKYIDINKSLMDILLNFESFQLILRESKTLKIMSVEMSNFFFHFLVFSLRSTDIDESLLTLHSVVGDLAVKLYDICNVTK
jgi:hypothetical protein